MSGKTVGIHYGAMAPPLVEQLEGQGLVFKDAAKGDALQGDAGAITRLFVRGILTDSEAHKARGRLQKRIVEAVVPLPKAGGA
jgi:hypothetical protein